ncbi:MAG: hypothetical protein HY376_01385 [Candidatus Blackburnbacteria bacterium]|nr:hypothetical protein [Candidatus Blackburnbacteria bacterium]
MSKKNVIIGTIVLVFLTVGLVVGMLLVKQQQDLRKNAAPATTLSILPPTKTANVGDEVNLTVQMNTATNTVTYAELGVTFDPQKLTLKDFTPLSEMLPIVFVSPQINNTTGTATIKLTAQPANPPQGQGGLATLKFIAKGPGTATVSFTPQTLIQGVNEGTNVLASQNSATITVLAPAAALPTPTTTTLTALSTGTTPTPTSNPIGGLGTTPTPATSTQSSGATSTSTPTPTSTTLVASGSATPVAGVSTPILLGILGGLALLLAGIALAL